MKIIRYQDHHGNQGYAARQADGTALHIDGNIYGAHTVTSRPADVVSVLAPVMPTAIICIGLNYRQHAAEAGMKIPADPVVFMKSVNATLNPDDSIEIPRFMPSVKVDYEGEMAVVIARKCKNVKPEDALSYVLGYTCANDVSARDWQLERSGGQWCRGKSFDTFAPLGPCLVTTDEIPNPHTLFLRTILNGEVVQSTDTGDMIFDVPALVSFLSGSTTLLPGTVILTGTPSGVGMACDPPRWLRPGDVVTVEIDGIGSLRNPVRTEQTDPAQGG